VLRDILMRFDRSILIPVDMVTKLFKFRWFIQQ